jgi:hypothetical protein
LGWNLSTPAISRKTAKRVPKYDTSDVFIFSGAEDLVPVEQVSASVTRYQPRRRACSPASSDMRNRQTITEVRGKNDWTNIYGTPGRAGGDGAALAHADPDRRLDVFAWNLTATTDPFGNRSEYEYLRDAGAEAPHRWDQLYLRTIRYADYIDAQNARKLLFEVRFVYEHYLDPVDPSRIDPRDIRPDAFSTCTGQVSESVHGSAALESRYSSATGSPASAYGKAPVSGRTNRTCGSRVAAAAQRCFTYQPHPCEWLR